MFGRKSPPPKGLADRVRQVSERPRFEPPPAPMKRQNQRPPREPTFRNGTISWEGGDRLKVVIKDLSESGARVEFFIHQPLPDVVLISEPTQKLRRQARVVWQRSGVAGLKFID